MKDRQRLALRTLLLWVLLELVAAAQVVNDDGVSVLSSWTRTAFSPATSLSTWLSLTAGDLYQGRRDFESVIADLRAKREEVDVLRARNVLLQEDLAALREALGVSPLIEELEAESRLARCTYRNLSQGLMQIHTTGPQIAHSNTAVLGGNGLVGRVLNSAQRRAWVQLITHPAAAVAVCTEDGTVHGLVTGSGPGELEIEYVPRAAALLRGVTMVTSGADGIYPPGIPVARVSKIRETDAAFLEVFALPTVDLATTRVVLLLPEWSLGRRGES